MEIFRIFRPAGRENRLKPPLTRAAERCMFPPAMAFANVFPNLLQRPSPLMRRFQRLLAEEKVMGKDFDF